MFQNRYSLANTGSSSQSADKDKEEYANQKIASKEVEIERLKNQIKTANKNCAQLEENLERIRSQSEQMEGEISF